MSAMVIVSATEKPSFSGYLWVLTISGLKNSVSGRTYDHRLNVQYKQAYLFAVLDICTHLKS